MIILKENQEILNNDKISNSNIDLTDYTKRNTDIPQNCLELMTQDINNYKNKRINKRFPEQGKRLSPEATEHLFEIPWNADPELIVKIYESPYKDKVKFVYMPCIYEHGECTRRENDYTLLTKDMFEKVVELIKECEFEPCVLMQRRVEPECIPYYHDLGIRYYTVGEDRIADYLREKYGNDVYITASITKDLMADDYEMYAAKYPDLYDIFILRHGFSKDIEGIINLPKELKYGIMPNLPCLWNCPIYRSHWFSWEENNEEINKYQFKCLPYRDDINNSMYIIPQDIWLFDPYITSYKIVGRTEKTNIIYNHLASYSTISIENNDISEEDKISTFAKYNIGHGVQKRVGNPIY